jgi:hypothetical protein
MKSSTNYKLVVFVPVTHSDSVRKAMGDAGAGIIGNYSFCTFSMRGTGRFKGNERSNPTVGRANILESVDEERVETICPAKLLEKVVSAIKEVHPYEEVALDIYPLQDL